MTDLEPGAHVIGVCIAGEISRLIDGAGADLVLESVGGRTLISPSPRPR